MTSSEPFCALTQKWVNEEESCIPLSIVLPSSLWFINVFFSFHFNVMNTMISKAKTS